MFNPTSLEKILRYLFLKCLKIYLFIHHGSRNFDIYLSEITGNVLYHPPWLEKIFEIYLSEIAENASNEQLVIFTSEAIFFEIKKTSLVEKGLANSSKENNDSKK